MKSRVILFLTCISTFIITYFVLGIIELSRINFYHFYELSNSEILYLYISYIINYKSLHRSFISILFVTILFICIKYFKTHCN